MIVQSRFRPSWWLPGAHLQTQFPTVFRRKPPLHLRRERIELPDGDFIDLDWNGNRGEHIILVLHGLEGSANSPYAAGILFALGKGGYHAVLMNFRGCSGEPNRLPRGYHSGETGDLDYVVHYIRSLYPEKALGVIGFSLGGNVLLKWLGEKGGDAPVDAAVAISVPFSLAPCANRLNTGFSRFYQWYLLRKLKRSLKRKQQRMTLPVPGTRDRRLKSLRGFDHHITAPLHGFRGAEHYYAESSSRHWLKQIAVTTLVLHAADDPFMTSEVIPANEELSPAITFELSRRGGHVGFITGRRPWSPRYWLEQRVIEFFHDVLPVAGTKPCQSRVTSPGIRNQS